ncbi:hypothetical protein TSUD_282420 [Trifolium subterraneum]|uniref:Ty3/gypsy retrotransposon protein n=1 Tax=Trifolium subterraneum TaxID=3900 RepID=A0A2Z6NVU7_TRISU|nr:hypothetical protein TSUD_282420 [Trifolium subterraneum]
MDARVASLEEEITGIKTTLSAMEKNQALLISMMEKSMGKSIFTEEESEVVNGKLTELGEGESGKKTGSSGVRKMQSDVISEFRQSAKKVELPMFDGDDPAGWISRAEVYFRVQGTTPAVKVDLAQLCMGGPTIHFFNSLLNEEEDLTWERLKGALVERYGGHGEGDVYEQLIALRQVGTVDEYITEFEYLTAQIPPLPDKQFSGYFLHGLKADIKGKVRSLSTVGNLSRGKLLQVTRVVEREVRGDAGMSYNKHSKSGHGSSKYGFCGSSKGSGADWVMVKGKESGPSGGSKNGNFGPRNERNRIGPCDRSFSHLSYNELLERKEKGLCFKCKAPYHPKHQCPEKHLRILITDDEETEEGGGKLLAVEVEEEEEGSKGELNIMSLLQLGQLSASKPQSIQLKGAIGGVPVAILVDSGATHNFIDKRLVQKMNWAVDDSTSMCIKLGDGSRAHSIGVCPDLKIDVDGVQLAIQAHLFELGGVDIVLGVDWLRTLGDIIMNWTKHTMSFWYKQKWVTFQGLNEDMEALNSIVSCSNRRGKGWMRSVEQKRGNENDLNIGQQLELEGLLDKYEDIFKEPRGLPPRREKEHVINLKEGHDAVNVRPYRYPHHHKNEIETQVQELLTAGVIRHSTSSFSSPVILVKKKDGSWRMCIDYRALNKATIPDKFPIPVIEELLDELHGATIFSKLDLKSGYHQVRVHKDDVHKTAFRTHEGHYEFLVMPFGLMNAPSTFQSLMNEVFRIHLRKFVLVFFDDILVYSRDWSTHLSHLEEVLSILQKHGLVANRKKCHFAQKSVDYLGHVISGKGVAVDPNKVESVMKWPIPKNVKGVRGFLGLTGYYRKFIKNYWKIARPLTELTKKDAFTWNEDTQKAFEKLKESLTTTPVLALPDFNKEFTIECDASGIGIGAILMQGNRPIAYFSKELGIRNVTKSAYEKELMAVVLAIQHWRPYLLGRHFTVSTDQKSLKQLLQQRIVTAEQQNWAAKLLGFDFNIVYKPGKLNRGADALSRVQKGAKPGFEFKQGVLLYDGRLVISSKSVLIPTLLKEFHETSQGGHSGFYRTYRRLAANVYWVGMKNVVQEFVRSCDVCQRQKYLASSPGGLLQPLPIPDRIWEDISMDFITGLPKSKGFEAILVVVDHLSKYCHFIVLKHPYTARTIAEVFVKEIVRLHGVPLSIVSDRDPIFMSNFWREMFKLQGTKLKMSSAYHPETDGQTEVVNRCLETYLRCFIADQPKTWVHWVPWAEYWFNTTYHASTGKTPFEVVYGRTPPTIVRWIQGEVRVEAVQKELLDRDEAIKQLKVHLLRAQDRMKQFADRKRCDKSFAIGEWVFVKLRAHRHKSVVSRISPKLAANTLGLT